MTDIVERLRGYKPTQTDCRDAADEIERLREQRDEARKTMREWSENCRAEVQRLRGLLREGLNSYGLPVEWYSRVREALGDE